MILFSFAGLNIESSFLRFEFRIFDTVSQQQQQQRDNNTNDDEVVAEAIKEETEHEAADIPAKDDDDETDPDHVVKETAGEEPEEEEEEDDDEEEDEEVSTTATTPSRHHASQQQHQQQYHHAISGYQGGAGHHQHHPQHATAAATSYPGGYYGYSNNHHSGSGWMTGYNNTAVPPYNSGGSFGWQLQYVPPPPPEYPGLLQEQQEQHMAAWRHHSQHQQHRMMDETNNNNNDGDTNTDGAGIAGWNGGDEEEMGIPDMPEYLYRAVTTTTTGPPRKKKKYRDSDVANTLMLLQTDNDNGEIHDTTATTTNAKEQAQQQPIPEWDTEWADLVVGSEFCHAGLRGDVPDSTLICVGQFRACGLTQDDRVGKYKNRPLNFTGMCCKYCGGQPGFGRYFPGSYDSLLNGTNFAGIVKHIKTDCRKCPPRVRQVILELEASEKKGSSGTTNTADGGSNETEVLIEQRRPKYGSRKRFFSYVWNRLREIQVPVDNNNDNKRQSLDEGTEDAGATDKPSGAEEDHGEGDSPDPAVAVEAKSTIDLEHILANSPIVSIKDRHLVSDTTLVAMAQMMVCVVTPDDKIGRCKDHTLGFKGLCCKHCGGKAGKPGYGRYFPSSLRSLAQADSCQQIIRHVASKCDKCPQDIRSAIIDLHVVEGNNNTTSSGRIKYGSRKIFFRRVWARLHGETASPDGAAVDTTATEDGTTTKESSANSATKSTTPNVSGDVIEEDIDIPWDQIIGDSPVVSLADRGLISDAQLAAIAQMNLCKLTEADQIGWFKTREVGFGGLCCKHCGGRPSFGRYFPNSVRSFAQTTSSQTIISHIALYCQECPKDIRDIVMHLQRKENYSNEGTITLNNSMYGSRKVFFDRAWARMHQHDATLLSDQNDDKEDDVDSSCVVDDAGTDAQAITDSSKRKRITEDEGDVDGQGATDTVKSANRSTGRSTMDTEVVKETAV